MRIEKLETKEEWLPKLMDWRYLLLLELGVRRIQSIEITTDQVE